MTNKRDYKYLLPKRGSKYRQLFVNGRINRGPRWMTEHGLEWLCRLAVEPRKLWRRYLIGNPQFLWRVLKEYRLRSLHL